MGPDFLSGLCFGAIFITLFGFVLGQIQRERNLAGAPNRPQMVCIPTDKTPWQVVRTGIGAFFRMMFWVIVLMIGVVVIVAGASFALGG